MNGTRSFRLRTSEMSNYKETVCINQQINGSNLKFYHILKN